MIRIAICDAFGRGVYGFKKKPLAYGKLEKSWMQCCQIFWKQKRMLPVPIQGVRKMFWSAGFCTYRQVENIRRSF